MQDLTLINAEDELALHTSDPRMRRDPMDEMSSGASTLPRAKSTAARQSKATCKPTLLHLQLHTVSHICRIHACILCVQLFGTHEAMWSHVI